jgi:hypothetical protein
MEPSRRRVPGQFAALCNGHPALWRSTWRTFRLDLVNDVHALEDLSKNDVPACAYAQCLERAPPWLPVILAGMQSWYGIQIKI